MYSWNEWLAWLMHSAMHTQQRPAVPARSNYYMITVQPESKMAGMNGWHGSAHSAMQ
jgi:hypothetical protein